MLAKTHRYEKLARNWLIAFNAQGLTGVLARFIK
jgi:hypothetical protein